MKDFIEIRVGLESKANKEKLEQSMGSASGFSGL
jgi:hypothetical protein